MSFSLFGKPEMDPKHDTIGDENWRDIQGRALKANPKLSDAASKESAAGRHRGAANYAKREQN